MRVASASACKAAGRPLPGDFASLHSRCGLSSFLSVPIGAGGRVLGTLMVASAMAGALEGPQWLPMVNMAASVLLPHINSPQLTGLCQALASFDEERDVADAAGIITHGMSRYISSTTHANVTIRLGLLRNSRMHNDRLLLVEPEPLAGGAAAEPQGEQPGAPGSRQLQSQQRGKVVAIDLPVERTLLGGALLDAEAKFIPDCALYLQRSREPATDVFTPSSKVVTSLAVVPVGLDSAAPLGGVYFASDCPLDFSRVRAPILGLVELAAPLLERKLARRADALLPAAAAAAAGGAGGGLPVGPLGGGGGGSFSDPGAAGPSSLPPFPTPLAPASWAAAGASGSKSAPLNTDAIFKSVQQRLVAAHSGPPSPRRRSSIEDGPEGTGGLANVALQKVIGRGSFGVCYRAVQNGATVAVKVLYSRRNQKDAMKDAMEMAVLTHLRHPGIVTVFECFTDCVEDASGLDLTGALLPRYRPAAPLEEGHAALCNVIIMEYCDRGTLRAAVRQGLFRRRMADFTAAVDLVALLKVLLDVARSMEYLHTRKLLHCDLKLDNILLRTDPTHEMGFTCKLADFGLAKMLNENAYVHNRSGSGTITHLAPEVLQPGAKLTTAVDVYAFGILMYEAYTGKQAYSGLRHAEVIGGVARGNLRPSFPPAAPAALVLLAGSCWAADPEARPGFSEVARELRRQLVSSLEQGAEGNDAAAERRLAPGPRTGPL